MPPKTLAPMKTGSKPKRPVRASGKASTVNAMKCKSLSLPSAPGRRLQGPEHCDRQDERHGDCQWDVEVLAHPPECIGLAKQRQIWHSVGRIRG